MKYPFLDLALANAPYLSRLQAAASAVIAGGRYLHGQQTAALEQRIAAVCQTAHCVAVSNGLDALRLILRAYIELGKLSKGDGVIVPANTYVASVLAISDSGLRPVLCDCNPTTMCLDTSLIESLLTPRIKAVMPVHLYGTPCCDHSLLETVRRHGLLMIEDNAQAIAARSALPGLAGTLATGGLGHAAGISFYPTKNLGALGDGGAVTTNDEALAHTVRALANYGSDRRYHNIYRGLNCRIDEIQAAMLLVKLDNLEAETSRREAVAQAYDEAITNPLVCKPKRLAGMRQVWHQYVVRVATRDHFRDYLASCDVGTDIHYATPPHRQPCYSEFADLSLPETERLAATAVSLPVAYPVTAETAREIARIINDYDPT